MPQRYEVQGSKVEIGQLIYVTTYKVVSISAPVTIVYEKGIYEPVVEIFFDVELDDGQSVRMHKDYAAGLIPGDEVVYNVSVDDFVKFTPNQYPVTLNLVA